MSLNWREIDAVLAELNLEGCWLKRIRQPDYHRILLEFSGSRETAASEGPAVLALVLTAPFVRINTLDPDRHLPKALPKPPRFNAVLKSRIEGSRLTGIEQLGRDRIVRFTFAVGGEPLYLDAKLWGNGANLILSGADGTIIDAFSRRPKRREAPGESWPPEGIGAAPEDEKDDRFPLRSLAGEGSWNERVRDHYESLERAEAESIRLAQWETYLNHREAALVRKAADIEKRQEKFRSQTADSHWADLIMANLHVITKGETHFETEDWEQPGRIVRIPLEETMSPQENAERYYARQKRALRAAERLDEDKEALTRSLESTRKLKERLLLGEIAEPPLNGPPPVDPAVKKNKQSPSLPGLWIKKDPHIIVVGRNAKESDILLRRWAKGNDTWLHVRDWPGGHVFVRSPRGKSVPLELLLDAGNLALSYSKAKSSMEADLYYTQVKNLKRAKDGPAGKVLPTREKNIHIRLDSERLAELKALAESA